MTGVQHLRIADFDTIAASNNNRMGASSVLNVGLPKASILARELYEFNPYLDLRVFPRLSVYRTAVRNGFYTDWADGSSDDIAGARPPLWQCLFG